MSETSTDQTVSGHIKWFDARKGFGFATVEGLPDILLHINVLRNYGQSAASEGTKFTGVVRETPRGFQLVEILELDDPQRTPAISEANYYNAADGILETLEILPARVKWFDTTKGFGFVTIFGCPDDVFIHMEVVRSSSLGAINAGEAVAVRTIRGERGLQVIQLLAWNVAVDDQACVR